MGILSAPGIVRTGAGCRCTVLAKGNHWAVDDPERGLLTGIAVTGVLVGLVLVFWPGTGAVAISWVIAALALMVGSLLVYLALHMRHVDQDISKLRQ